ncbi:hypothetical protein WK40_31620 [Burkholderia cepacia]|uniref:DUF4376 domain-containing protein n=1 Tax=Burkholderia cepacia TaxID=292 RepID=UPI00075D6B3A|nr:DUF4376 domain-containing protein [Burkholderia cepacia]KVS54317.1 hypothetical protein WK40_31620 [Burkholderia cepacia]
MIYARLTAGGVTSFGSAEDGAGGTPVTVIAEIIHPLFDADGVEIPIADRFAPEFVSELVDVTSVTGAAVGWVYANGTAAAPAGPSLAEAQEAQAAAIDNAYAIDVQQSVTFKTAAGTTKAFQADTGSQQVLMVSTQGYTMAGAVPPNFYWVAADNSHVEFTLADLQGLYQAMLDRGWAAFRKRQDLKAQIAAATTVAAVQSITW